ncbi:uncharacterized protein, partial [Chironomus tepperi]
VEESQRDKKREEKSKRGKKRAEESRREIYETLKKKEVKFIVRREGK